jgi:hypothetical protein
MASGAVKTDWSRYELDDNGDFLTDDEGNFVERAVPAAPKSNLREDVTFAGSEKAGKGASAVFPRTAKAVGEGKGYGSQALAAGVDLLSLPGRTIASTRGGEAGANPFSYGKPFGFNPEALRASPGSGESLEALAETKGKSFGGRIVRDPGMAAALLLAPFTGGLSSLPVYGRLAAQGTAAGAASAGAHQADNVLEGEGVKAGQALGEIALNALIPMAGKAIAQPLKKAGVKILHSVIKPEKAVLKAGYGRPGDAMHGTRAILESGRGGTLKSSLEQVESRADELGDLVEDILLQKSRKATITTPGAKPAPSATPRGVETTGRPVSEAADDVIFTGTPGKPALGGLQALPESTVPGAPDVVPAGPPTSPALLERTRGTPEVLTTPPPRPRSQPPEVVIPPNRTAMPNQIDPRFVRPQARSTTNQPPIPDALPGEAYGVPSGRNLPAALGNRQVQGVAEAAEDLAEAVGATPEEVLRFIEAPAGKPTVQAGGASAGAAPQGRALPPGAQDPPGTTRDITKIVDLLGALQGAKKGLGQEMAAYEHAGLLDDIGSGVSQWADDIGARGTGVVTPLQALKYQRGVGKFGKFDYGQNPQLIPPKSRVANKFYERIGDKLEEVAPEIGPLRREQSELIPQRMALMAALARTDKNFALQLKEAIAAASAMAGAGAAGPAGALPGLSLAGTIHASQSPRVANALYKAGGSLDRESAMRDAVKRLLLQAGFSEPQEP